VKTVLDVYTHTRLGDDEAAAEAFGAGLDAEAGRLAGEDVTSGVTTEIAELDTRRSAQGE